MVLQWSMSRRAYRGRGGAQGRRRDHRGRRQAAASLKLYELRKQLRDEAPGTAVTFTIRRAGAEKSVLP